MNDDGRQTTLRAGSLIADYTLAFAPVRREWVAIGSVRDSRDNIPLPALILVGVGETEQAAVDDLTHLMVRESDRLLLLGHDATTSGR